MTAEGEVIDLTSSFSLSDHRQLENLIIEIDDSPVQSTRTSRRSRRDSKSTSNRGKAISYAVTNITTQASMAATTPNKQENNFKGFGDCPICWDKLGHNSLASTRCGHVFCLQCIEQVAIQTKRCPTCRCVLKGASAYHPLYISLQ